MRAKRLTNQEVVEILTEIEATLVVKGNNRFEIRAYQNVIEAIENLNTSVYGLWESNKLGDIPGVGPAIRGHLDELFRTGKVKNFEQFKKDLPQGMFELLKVEGIGPKKAYFLAKEFGLSNRKTARDMLLEAAKANMIAPLDGYGKKSQEKIIEGLKKYQDQGVRGRTLIYRADEIIDRVMAYMADCPGIEQISPLGSYRRRCETIGDLDIGIATKDKKTVGEYIKKFPNKQKVLVAGEGTVRVIDETGMQIDFKMVIPEWWGSLLQHFSGSKQHNVALREMAIAQGKSMSEQGMKILGSKENGVGSSGKWKRFKSEVEFYKELGLEWIEPEMRENTGEIELAQHKKLPDLVELKDIKGDLHTHTNYNWINSHDAGLNSPAEMVGEAEKLDYEYISIGDHNPSVSSYDTKKTMELLKKRRSYIDQINDSREMNVKGRSIKVFNSLEVDINPDGNLAIPDGGEEYLDLIVASVHSVFNLNVEKMTQRVLKALSKPKVKVLGHPTGRLIQKREGYSLDWDKVFSFAKSKNIAIEINANPNRLDLSYLMVKEAVKKGVKLVINTDAHDMAGLHLMKYGIDVARRGWATKESIVNTWPLDRFQDWLKS